MWETCRPAVLQETLLPWVMLASIPARKHRSMNRNPAHGWINLTVVRSDERGKSVDNSGDINRKKKTRTLFLSLSDWEKRNKGWREWETEWNWLLLSIQARHLPPQEIWPFACVRKSMGQKVKEREAKSEQWSGHRNGWVWYRFGRLSLSLIVALNRLILISVASRAGGGGGGWSSV